MLESKPKTRLNFQLLYIKWCRYVLWKYPRFKSHLDESNTGRKSTVPKDIGNVFFSHSYLFFYFHSIFSPYSSILHTCVLFPQVFSDRSTCRKSAPSLVSTKRHCRKQTRRCVLQGFNVVKENDHLCTTLVLLYRPKPGNFYPENRYHLYLFGFFASAAFFYTNHDAKMQLITRFLG